MSYRIRRLLKPLRDLYHYNRFRVDHWSDYENIYHCCTQKTASQWFSAIFRDPVVYRCCGLKPYPYVQVRLKEASFKGPLPRRTIDIHLYIDHPAYLTIPKPASYKTFFILRDPRDIVVSFYFSTKFSYPEKFYIRAQGEEAQKSHYRKGVAGDWCEHFDDSVNAHFMSVTGDLLDVLGYQKVIDIKDKDAGYQPSLAAELAHNENDPPSDHHRLRKPLPR